MGAEVIGPDAAAAGERRWRRAGILALAALAALVLATFRDYGSTWDEEVHFLHGEQVLAWYRSLFRDRAVLGFGDLHLYGGLFDALAQLLVRVSPFGLYETRHLASAATGLLALWATWRLGTLVGGARTGLAALVLLALVPAFHGHAFANPKDVPFAAFATLGLYLVLRASRELPRPRPILLAGAGLSLGAALGVRPAGLFLLAYVPLTWAAAVPGGGAPLRGVLSRIAVAAAAVAAVAWATMLAFWPWAQLSPIARPIQATAAATRFVWIGEMLFDGRKVWSNDLPWSYLPTWFAVTLPEAFLLALAAGAVVAARSLAARAVGRRAALDAAFLAFCALFPIGAAIATRPVMYDAHRQFLFVLPPLAVLAGWGLVSLLSERSLPRAVRAAAGLAAAAGAAVTVADMVQIHPYQTVYFNRLIAGGLPAASARFETDYWGSSYREGVEEVVRRYRAPGPRPVTVANCSVSHLTAYWLSRLPEAAGRFVNVRPEEDPDLFLATTRDGCHRQVGVRTLHVVERKGTPLLYVLERHPRGVWMAGP